MILRSSLVVVSALLFGCAPATQPASNTTPPCHEEKANASKGQLVELSSWRDSASRDALLEFVSEVTDDELPSYVSPAERIAVFDNDGTLWVEQPMYAQLAFALDRVQELAPQHPEWKSQKPFSAILAGNAKSVLGGGKEPLLQLVMATHAGVTTEQFTNIVTGWLDTARHPRFQRRYDELVYKPMLELLDYLRARDFKTYIVSGGGVEFMRAFAERVYGIPPEQVIGSSLVSKYDATSGEPAIAREAKLEFIDDEAGKPVGIQQRIGRRPLIAVGNSDGDLEMLDWTTAAPGKRLGVLIHHTDAQREYAYDEESSVGRLDEALARAPQEGWVVVDMQNDWETIF